MCDEWMPGIELELSREQFEELPRNPSGKILKKILRQPYWEGAERNIG